MTITNQLVDHSLFLVISIITIGKLFFWQTITKRSSCFIVPW